MSKFGDVISENRAAVILTSLGLSAAIIILIVASLGTIRSDVALSRNLRLADVLIREERVAEALELLGNSLAFANSPRDYLAIISRADLLRESLGDSALYSRAIDRGFDAYPGNDVIRALLVDRLLDGDEAMRASIIAEGLEGRRYLGLVAEAFLRSGRSLERHGLEGVLQGVQLPLTPVAMSDPFAMFEAGQLTGDIRYFVNGSLLLASRGRIQEAYDILSARGSLLSGDSDAAVLLNLAYDSRMFSEVQNLAALLPTEVGLQASTMQSLADMYFFSGDAARAYELHHQVTDRHPDDSRISVLNLLRMHGSLGIDSQETSGSRDFRELYRRTFELYGNDPEVLARGLSAAVTRDEASELDFIPQISRFPENFDMGFYRLLTSYLDSGSAGERSIDIVDLSLRLWDRINAAPSDAESRNLLLYLLSIQDDRRGIEVLLNRYSAVYDGSLELYSGYLSVLGRDTDQARRSFAFAGEAGRPEGFYNLGLMELAERRPSLARDYLLRAEDLIASYSGGLSDYPGSSWYRQMVEVRVYLAMSLALLDDMAGAREYINRIRAAGARHILLPRVEEMIAARRE